MGSAFNSTFIHVPRHPTRPGPQLLGKDFETLITVKEEEGREKPGEKRSQKGVRCTDRLSFTTTLVVSFLSRPREVRTWLADSRAAQPGGNPVVGHEACQSLPEEQRISCSPGWPQNDCGVKDDL